MEALLGNTLLTKEGVVPTADALANAEVVGLYFSAHWCPPCRNYTPKLADTYKELRNNNLPFEIVFVSSDKDDASFSEYYSTHPWKALPFAERGLKETLSKLYKVRGIPTLVLLDGKTGELITTKGRDVVTVKPKAFPWKPPTLKEMLGGTFHTAGTAELTPLVMTKALLLYFSAHWCPPCQRFTPKLAAVYKKLKAEGKDLEVVFISSDRDIGGFQEYYGTAENALMPWRAMPFAERELKEALSGHFEVEGIPSLVVLDENLDVINDSAVGLVAGDDAGDNFPWPKPLVGDLDESVDDINSVATVVVLMEKAEAAWDDCEAALEEAAKASKEAGHGVAFAKASEVGGVGGQVRKLCKLGAPTKEPAVVLLNLDDEGAYYHGPKEVTAESLKQLVAEFKKGALERQQA